jgi:MFS family permease
LVEFFGSRKRVSVITLSIGRLLLFPLVLVAMLSWLFPAQAWLWLVLFLVIVTLHSGFTAIGGTAWQSWSGTIVPMEKRANYFANRSTYIGALGLITTLLAGIFLDWWKLPGSDGQTVHPFDFNVILSRL